MQNRQAVESIKIGDRHRMGSGDIADLARSISEIGLLQPVVVTPDNRLIAGFRRLAAVKSLGWLEVPVHVVDIEHLVLGELAENQMRKGFLPSEISSIADEVEELERGFARQRMLSGLKTGNRRKCIEIATSERGRTRDKLARRFGISGRTLDKIRQIMRSDFEDLKAELDETGRVNGLYLKLSKRVALKKFAQESRFANDKFRPNSIIHGDCVEILPQIPEASFDAVVTDPPYGLGIDYGGSKDHDNPDDYWKWFEPIYRELWRVLKPGGFLCIFQAAKFLHLFGTWFGSGFHVFPFCRTAGNSHRNRLSLHSSWQPALMWYKPGSQFLSPMLPMGTADFFVSDGNLDVNSRKHASPKPLDLMIYIISSMVIEGGYVLDPFCGSGTTPVACQRLNRAFIGVDNNAGYCRLSEERIIAGE